MNLSNKMSMQWMAAIAFVSLLNVGCNEQTTKSTANDEAQGIFPKGELAPPETFKGKAWNYSLVANDAMYNTSQIVRLAKLVIDSSQLENYKAKLKEGIETAVRLEPGVLTLYAVAEKDNPTHITILEIYADTEAYKAHLQTPHFIKYKTGTKDMIKSLELVETVPLIPGMKIK